jgi:hypothetical protein
MPRCSSDFGIGPTINCEFLPSYKEPIAGVIMPFGEAGSTDPCCRRRGSHSVYLTSRTARGVGSEIEGFDGGKIGSLHSGILLRPRFIRGASRKVFRSRWTRGSSRNRARKTSTAMRHWETNTEFADNAPPRTECQLSHRGCVYTEVYTGAENSVHLSPGRSEQPRPKLISIGGICPALST